MDTAITGFVEPGFESVREAFAHNFERDREVGAAFCLHVDGRKVVDICGGYADAEHTQPYTADTLQLVFSTTKGATAICANLLAQRGELDLNAPVSSYWPEFAQAGKEDIPVWQLLSHQAGVPALDAELTAAEAQAWDPMIQALEVQTPFWEPGTAHGYHAVTYGYLVGEVIRRLTGRTLGTFFAEEVAQPLGLEFWIGLPEEHEQRVSPMVGSLIPANAGEGGGIPSDFRQLLVARALNAGGAFSAPAWWNDPAWHAAEVPAANGITNAASLSRLYAAVIGTVDGGPPEPLLTREQVDRARTPRTFGGDQVFASVGFPIEQLIGQGFWIANPYALFGGEGAFGHAGAGGSYGFADPDHKLAVGYVMNNMSAGLLGDPRSHRLVRSCYESVGVTPKYI